MSLLCARPGPPERMLGGQGLELFCPNFKGKKKVAAIGNFKCPNWQRGLGEGTLGKHQEGQVPESE